MFEPFSVPTDAEGPKPAMTLHRVARIPTLKARAAAARLTSVGVERVMRATRPLVSKASQTPSLPTMTRHPLSGMRTCSHPACLGDSLEGSGS